MANKGLDERQVRIRDSIGNQTFILQLYLLLIDAALYGLGFRWINYPANIMIILSICSGIYVIRLIAANAFLGPSAKTQRPLLKVVLTVFLAILVSVAVLVLAKNTSLSSPGHIEEISAPILFVTAGVALLIAFITFFISQARDRDDE